MDDGEQEDQPEEGWHYVRGEIICRPPSEVWLVPHIRGAISIRTGGWTTRNLKCWFSATEREKNLPGVKINPKSYRGEKVARYQNMKNDIIILILRLYYTTNINIYLNTLMIIHSKPVIELKSTQIKTTNI